MPYKDKAVARQKAREYVKRNPERVRATKARYRQKSREKLRLQSQEYHSKNEIKERDYLTYIKYKYGLSKEDYFTLFNSQNGVCAICGGVNNKNRRLHIDHDHYTGRVRALLCHRCNIILGLCNESEEILLLLINYIREVG